MTNERPERSVVELVKSSYQPSKADLEESIDLGDLTPDDVVKALLQPVDVRYVSRPNRK